MSKVVKRSQKKTADAHKKRAEKKAKKKKEAPAKKVLEPIEFSLDMCEGGQTNKKRLTSTRVQHLMRECLEEAYGDTVTIPGNREWWGAKERTLAKKLLEMYGWEEVERAVRYMCANWEKMVEASGGTLRGIPTINILFASRNIIFADASLQRGFVKRKRPAKKDMPDKDFDEYVDPGEDVGHGW